MYKLKNYSLLGFFSKRIFHANFISQSLFYNEKILNFFQSENLFVYTGSDV